MVAKKKVLYAWPNQTSPTQPVIFDPAICNGCNNCIDVCQTDVFMPNPEAGKPPIIMYPDECWYCAPCVDVCPKPGAIVLNYPVMWRVPWKDKKTGKLFWVGMKNPPSPNTKPAP